MVALREAAHDSPLQVARQKIGQFYSLFRKRGRPGHITPGSRAGIAPGRRLVNDIKNRMRAKKNGRLPSSHHVEDSVAAVVGQLPRFTPSERTPKKPTWPVHDGFRASAKSEIGVDKFRDRRPWSPRIKTAIVEGLMACRGVM